MNLAAHFDSGRLAAPNRPTLRRWPPSPSTLLPAFFVAPALLVIGLVSIYPVLDAAVLSLFNTRYAVREDFVGLLHYRALLSDPSFWAAGWNSLVFTFGTLALVIPFSLAIALLLNSGIPFRNVVRTIVILPWVLSQTIVALLWAWLINADFGPMPYLASLIAGVRPALLATPEQAMGTLILVNAWATYPQAALLLLAALQTVPRELYEAAMIDGAGRLGRFRFVTLPQIRPTLLVVMIQLTLLYFNLVTLIYVLTGGGPLSGTETLALKVLKISFEDWNLGRGAALGLIITVINLAFSLAYLRVLRGGRDV